MTNTSSEPREGSAFGRVLREPLLHFLVVGVALLALSLLGQGEGAVRPDQLVVTSGRIEQLIASWVKARTRPPTRDELDALIEDYGDEWLTKPMFHYRWAYAADVEKAGAILPLWRGADMPPAAHAKFSKIISQRHI